MENTIVEKRQYKKDRTVEGNQEKERKAERKQTETITHETTGNGKNENKNIHLKVWSQKTTPWSTNSEVAQMQSINKS